MILVNVILQKYPRKTLAHFQSNNDNNKQQEASTMYVLQN